MCRRRRMGACRSCRRVRLRVPAGVSEAFEQGVYLKGETSHHEYGRERYAPPREHRVIELVGRVAPAAAHEDHTYSSCLSVAALNLARSFSNRCFMLLFRYVVVMRMACGAHCRGVGFAPAVNSAAAICKGNHYRRNTQTLFRFRNGAEWRRRRVARGAFSGCGGRIYVRQGLGRAFGDFDTIPKQSVRI